MVTRRDSGVVEFYYRRISAVKQWKPLRCSQSKNLNFFEFSRVSPGAHPLTKKPEDSGYEIVDNLICGTVGEVDQMIVGEWGRGALFVLQIDS